MKKSLTYYIILWVLQLKGVKKTFSKDPIDYKKLRKEDIRQPKGAFFRRHLQTQFSISDTKISEIKYREEATKLLLFVHGGGFVSGPGQHHWDAVSAIARQTSCTVWMCDYPKAPEANITAITQNMDAVYDWATQKYEPENIMLIGDSVGGLLITALMQRLVEKNKALPAKIILVSPVMDAAFSNPKIDEIDKTDPMLSKKGVLSAKMLCAGGVDLKDPLISPINGSFEKFPKTVLFLAENDISYPDQKILIGKLDKANIDFEVITGKGMPHIWPFLPVMKEAKMALDSIIGVLNEE